MPRSPARATQADIARAIRAAAQVGSKMSIEVLPDGTIRLTPYSEIQPEPPAPARKIVLVRNP